MENDGLPVSLGIIIGAVVLGALIVAGLIVGLLLSATAVPTA
jgi:hypothetical protein